jgi:outer membrane protein assembly factor BamD
MAYSAYFGWQNLNFAHFMKRAWPILLLIVIISTSCASKFSKVLKNKDNEFKYKMAEQYYAKGKYNYAQQLFEELFPYIKGTPRFEDMYYKYAYTAYYQNDYSNAENLFKSFSETFPNGLKAEEAEYMRAFSFYKQSPKVELDQSATLKAISLMQAFITQHPTSARVKEASMIIDEGRQKLEEKEFRSAELYYNLGYYRAAAVAYAILMENYPDSQRADEYKLNIIKSYYRFAEMSIPERQPERFEKVIEEVQDFMDRFPDSKFAPEATTFRTTSTNNIKNLQNEQAKKATQL